MQPQLIVGHVMHRRLRPIVHAFVYPVVLRFIVSSSS